MERFEFEVEGIDYLVFAMTDRDDGGEFVTYDVQRQDDQLMMVDEERRVRRDFNEFYYSQKDK